jgi:hypothetical protein
MNIFYLRVMLKLIRNAGHDGHAPPMGTDAAANGCCLEALYTSNFHFIDNLSSFYYYQ